MVYKIFLFCLLSLTATSNIQAQDQIVDIITLNDSTVYEGEIILHKIGKYTLLRDAGGEIREYKDSEIASISTRRVKFHPPKRFRIGIVRGQVKLPKGEFFIREKGPFFQLGFGLYFNEGFVQSWRNGSNLNALIVNPSLSLKLGYRIKPAINLAVGYSLDGYRRGNNPIILKPISLQVSGDVPIFKDISQAVLPHYEVGIGYASDVITTFDDDQLKGGLMFNTALGWKLRTRGRIEWMLNLGYKFQHTSEERNFFQPDPAGGPGTISTIKGVVNYQKIYIELVVDFVFF